MKPLTRASALRLAKEFGAALESRGWDVNVSEARKVTAPGEDIILIRLGRPNGRDDNK